MNTLNCCSQGQDTCIYLHTCFIFIAKIEEFPIGEGKLAFGCEICIIKDKVLVLQNLL